MLEPISFHLEKRCIILFVETLALNSETLSDLKQQVDVQQCCITAWCGFFWLIFTRMNN